MCAQSKGRCPQPLFAAVLIIVALLHAVNAASNRADTSYAMTVSENDGEVIVNPFNPIVTVATVSRGRRPRHPKRSSIGRRASPHELVITTSVDNGPTGRWKLGPRARRQQQLQQYQPDEQELLQEQQVVQDDNDSLLKDLRKQSEQGKLKGSSKPAASSASTSRSKKSTAHSTATSGSTAANKATTPSSKTGSPTAANAAQQKADHVPGQSDTTTSAGKQTATGPQQTAGQAAREGVAGEDELGTNADTAEAGSSSSTGSADTTDNSSGGNEDDAAAAAAAEDGTPADSADSESNDAADISSNDSNSGSGQKGQQGSSKRGSNKHNKHVAPSETKAQESVPKAKWVTIQQPNFDSSAAVEDDLEEADAETELGSSTDELEEEAALAELDSQGMDTALDGEFSGGDATSADDEDAEDDVPPRRATSHSRGNSRSKASGSSQVRTTKKTSRKHGNSSKAKAAAGSVKHKTTHTTVKQVRPDAEQEDAVEDVSIASEADTQADAAAAPASSSSTQQNTTSTSSSEDADKHTDSMPWTLTGRSKTISIATPGKQGDADSNEGSAAAAKAPNATAALAAVAVAAARRVSVAGTIGSSSSSSGSSALGGTSMGDALQQKSSGLSAQDISQQLAASLKSITSTPQTPAAGSAAASSSQQAPAPVQNLDEADADDGLQLLDGSDGDSSDGDWTALGMSATDFDATASTMGLSNSKSSKSTGRASSSTSSSVAVAALTNKPKQDQVPQVLGGASAELLRKAMDHVALMRDVVFKLAAKPNLLQLIQQKQIRQLADTLDAGDVAEMSAIPGLLGLPTIYRAGDDMDSQLYAKKTALAVAITLFSHITPDQAVTMAGMLIPGYVTLGLTFAQLNKRLYDAAINTQLDEIFEAVMTGRGSIKSDTAGGTAGNSNASQLGQGGADQPATRTMNVAKSDKVAGFLVLALLLQARALVCGF